MPNILVVDDEELAADVLMSLLEQVGMTGYTARSAREAIELMSITPLDAVIIDLSLPEGEMTGILVLEVATIRRIPAFILSGWVTEERQEELRQSGAAGIFHKPCQFVTLLFAIRQVLEQHRLAA